MRQKRGFTGNTLGDGVLFAAFITLGILIAAKLEINNLQEFSGPFLVLDGDTLRQGEDRLRIEGIDAPELDQVCTRAQASWACGQEARQRLRDISATSGFSCKGDGRDRYMRILVRCSSDAVDAGEQMVSDGLAIAVDDTYVSVESEARKRNAGLWAGEFDMPRDWRRASNEAEKADSGQGMFATILEFIGWLR